MKTNPTLTAVLLGTALSIPATLITGPAATAATVSFGGVPAAAQMNPLAVLITGDVRENKTRTWPLHKNPWPTAGKKPSDDPNAFFTSVGRASSATYAFARSGGASFVWGSPDYYNKIEFLLGGSVVDSYHVTPGVDISPAFKGAGAALATFSNIIGGVFDGLRFTSTQYSFEFANLTVSPPAPVPLPAGVVLILTAMSGFALARRRKA